MIISRTPLRISFVGGGSDISDYYLKKEGAVVTTAINKYIYITVNNKFDNSIRASYSKTEIVKRVGELKHPIIRECLKKVGIKGGIEITSISDIPSEGTGLGSSSSFTVGLLNALYTYSNTFVGAERLAKEACEIEIEILKSPIGKQDQYITAYGGFQYFRFLSDESVFNTQIIMNPHSKENLQKRLLLLYTGVTRSSNKILAQQKNLSQKKTNVQAMEAMVNLAKNMHEELSQSKINKFGRMLDENWNFKKSLASSISSDRIDKWYKKAIEMGAEGGKILGAGGGGFLLLYAMPKYHQTIIRALPELRPVPFEFESQGSKIIFVEN